MFKKIFNFASGYVIIRVAGKNKERFVNMCLANGLNIWGVTARDDFIFLSISNADFMRIRRLVRKCDVRVGIVSKHGRAEIVKKHGHRCGFMVALTAVCIYFIFVPQYIWCVEIDGAKNADTARIEEILREMGVYVGAKKKNIADLSDIKNAVVFGDDEVNWAWLYIEGAKARLQIQESTPVPEVADKSMPVDIAAACDGYVRKAVVKRGERRVNVGQTVSKGQILISGKVAVFREGYPEKYSYVHSIGKIVADTIRVAEDEFSDTETLRVRTGNKKTRFSAELFGKCFDFFGENDLPYEEYDTETVNYDASLPLVGYLGFGINVHKIYEVNVAENTLTEQEILSRAKERLEESICKRLGTGAVKTAEELTYSVDGGVYTVRLKMRLRENIGMEIPNKE